MRSGSDITYLIYVDDDTIPLEPNMTLGNHLENDVVIPVKTYRISTCGSNFRIAARRSYRWANRPSMSTGKSKRGPFK